MRARRLAVLVMLAVPAAACAIAALDYTGKPCPCPDGWSCVKPAGTCTSGSAGDGGPDASIDHMAPADGMAPDDAMTPDAPDAPPDGGIEATWCQQKYPDLSTCWDFDEDATTLSPYDLTPTGDPSGTSLDTQLSFSPPRSLLGQRPSSPDGGSYAAYAQTNALPSATNGMHLQFQIHVDNVTPAVPFVTVAQLYIGANTKSGRSLGLLFYPSEAAALQEQVYTPDGGRPVYGYANNQSLGPGWHAVKLDVSFDTDASVGSATLSIDMLPSLKISLQPGWATGLPTLQAGIVFGPAGLAQATAVHFDDVVLQSF